MRVGGLSSWLKKMMRNNGLSSKHTKELSKGVEATGEKSMPKVYGEMQGDPKDRNSLGR